MITTQELIDYIYDDNLIHFDDRDTSDDCDCHIHITLQTMIKYMEAIECQDMKPLTQTTWLMLFKRY